MVSFFTDVGPVAWAVIFLLLCLAAEVWHLRRLVRVRHLAFGPEGRIGTLPMLAAFLRPLAVAGIAWSGVTLFDVQPAIYNQNKSIAERKKEIDEHVIFVVDVSPSMNAIKDAGPSGDLTRTRRAHDVVESFLARGGAAGRKLSCIAFYTTAKPVVQESIDRDVVLNVLDDLPLEQAFLPGQTNILAGIRAAFEMCRTWNPDSTNIVIVTDGDTVPATGMPRRPASVDGIIVLGVGDTQKGTTIAGRQSRQDVNAMRQLATRLDGTYLNANASHVATSLIREFVKGGGDREVRKWGRREYALFVFGLSALILAVLPLLLHFFGTRWRAGVPRAETLVRRAG